MKTILYLSELLRKLGGVLLVAMMVLTMADVIGGIFNYPVFGAEEIVALMTAVLLAFALPATQIRKGHVGVDILYRLLSPRAKKITEAIINMVGGAFFLVMGWQCVVYGVELTEAGEVSPTVEFPVQYLLYAMAFACLIIAIVMFIEFGRGRPLVETKGH